MCYGSNRSGQKGIPATDWICQVKGCTGGHLTLVYSCATLVSNTPTNCCIRNGTLPKCIHKLRGITSSPETPFRRVRPERARRRRPQPMSPISTDSTQKHAQKVTEKSLFAFFFRFVFYESHMLLRRSTVVNCFKLVNSEPLPSSVHIFFDPSCILRLLA